MTDQGHALRACSGARSQPWFAPIDLSRPFWRDYRELIRRLQDQANHGPGLPAVPELQRILSDYLVSPTGQAVKLVPDLALPGIDYEMRIFRKGEISTREHSWHDLFNALVWARFPRLKSALNAVHCQQIGSGSGQPRGRMRDALTLLDECGVILAGTHNEILQKLSARNWQAAFRDQAACWQEDTQVFVFGHALLEKFLRPYRSLTAHALLLRLDPVVAQQPRENLLQLLDARLAGALLQGALFASPAGLSPVPLMGIPGWWPRAEQNEAFYSDRQVFRRPAGGFVPAPVFDWAGLENHQDMP